MINKMNFLKTIFILAFLISACNTKMNQKESPLATVIKLQSAETFANLDEAKKYIDVEMVYLKDRPDSITAEKAWETYVMFGYNMAKDKKFTNIFKYHNYNIKEEVAGDNATVLFESKDSESNISRIVYGLENRNNQWIVISIEFVKSDS